MFRGGSRGVCHLTTFAAWQKEHFAFSAFSRQGRGHILPMAPFYDQDGMGALKRVSNGLTEPPTHVQRQLRVGVTVRENTGAIVKADQGAG